MKKGDKTIFRDRLKLTEMLNLRLNGFSMEVLASFYGCNRKSIEFQCDKYDVAPVGDIYSFGVIKPFLPKLEYKRYKIRGG